MKFDLLHTLDGEIENAASMADKLAWFAKNNYTVKLPKYVGANSTREEIAQAVTEEFQQSKEIFDGLAEPLEELLARHEKTLDDFFSNFDYRLPEVIRVRFTSYGPGGSYRPPDRINVMLKDDPQWALQMIVHETIHIIIEEPLIKKFDVPHWEKEALVDTLCLSERLKEVCPNYKRQKQTTTVPETLIEKLRLKNQTSLTQR